MKHRRLPLQQLYGITVLATAAVLLFSGACNTHSIKPIESALITETEARDFIAAYDKAWDKRDTTTMKQIMGEKYIYFTSTGSIVGLHDIIGWFTPADKYKVDTAKRSEIRVILNGNTAIVESRWAGSGTFGTEKFNDDQRCGLVLQKIKGKVSIIAEHCTQIANKE